METIVKCPVCLEKINAEKLKPIHEWEDNWTEVKCLICKNRFSISAEIVPMISSDFDFSTFRSHFDVEKLPEDVNRDYFNKARACIARDKQKELKEGFEHEETKRSYEFAIIHHQRVRRLLMPVEKKKAS